MIPGGIIPGGVIPGGTPLTELNPDPPVIMSCEPGIISSRSCETISRCVVVTFFYSFAYFLI
jgi:hypothetical protein